MALLHGYENYIMVKKFSFFTKMSYNWSHTDDPLPYKEICLHSLVDNNNILSLSPSLRFHYSVFYSLDVIHRSSFVPPLCYLLDPSVLPSLNHHAAAAVLSPSSSSPFDASFSSSQGSQTDQAAVCRYTITVSITQIAQKFRG